MSHRLQVLTAVKALIAATRPGADVRGMTNTEAKPEEVAAAGEAIVRAGDPGDPAIDLSPPTYTWDHAIPIELRGRAAPGLTSQQVLDLWMVDIGTAIAANRTLGGLCTWLDASAPLEGEADAYGAVPVGWADFTIIATYETSSPLA